MPRPVTILLATIAAIIGLLASPAAADRGGSAFPDTIALPDGFFPEGIAVDRNRAHVGSLADGAIVTVDLRTGGSTLLAPSPGPGRISVGMDVDRHGRLWVAGGGGAFPGVGAGYRVVDTTTGATLADVQLPLAGFVNDVIITRDAAWFTDSFTPNLIRVPIGVDGSIGTPRSVALAGDWVQTAGFNANGIVATPDQGHLIVAQSTGPQGGPAYYTVPADPAAASLEASRIEVDGTPAGADGLVLIGRHTLYSVGGGVVTELELSGDLARARVVEELAVPDAITPTTADVFGSRLYVVDAKFPLSGDPTTSYRVTAIAR